MRSGFVLVTLMLSGGIDPGGRCTGKTRRSQRSARRGSAALQRAAIRCGTGCGRERPAARTHRQRRPGHRPSLARALPRRWHGQRPDDRTRALPPDPSGAVDRCRAGRVAHRSGQQLYLEGATGAAASLFDTLFDRSRPLTASARERVLDWWASALDREARPRPDIERQTLYQRIRDRMRERAGRNPGVPAASYWHRRRRRGKATTRRHGTPRWQAGSAPP